MGGGKGLAKVLCAMGRISLGTGWDGSVVHPFRGMKEAARVPGSQVMDLVLHSLQVWQGLALGTALPWAVGRRSCSPWQQHRQPGFHQVLLSSCWEVPAWALEGRAGTAAPEGGECVAPLLLHHSAATSPGAEGRRMYVLTFLEQGLQVL